MAAANKLQNFIE